MRYLLIGLALAWLSSSSAVAQIETPSILVSSVVLSGVSGNGGSFAPAFSADGRFLVFVSQARNLVTNGGDTLFLDVFVHEFATGTIKLVSVNSSGSGGGDGNSNYPLISSNGQFIAFESDAGNLISGDTNGVADIYVRDLLAGTTTLVSRDITGSRSGKLASSNPVMTPDGRWIAFTSAATNLVAGDANPAVKLFLHDRLTTNTSLRGASNPNVSGTPYESIGISDDGSRLAFISSSPSLVPGATNDLSFVYVRDQMADTTFWASTNAGNYLASPIRCLSAVLSADGRVVVFKASGVTNGSLKVILLRHDLQTGQTTLLSVDTLDSTFPVMTRDGRFVSSEISSNVFLWDAQSGMSNLISVNLSGTMPGNSRSHTPAISSDGAKVAFISEATDLTTNDGSGAVQLYVRDVVAGSTQRVSARSNGAPSRNLFGVIPAINFDGNQIAFDSFDANLVSNDLNQASDVFVRSLDAATTQLVSRRALALASRTPVGASQVGASSMSADGRLIVFTAFDGELSLLDTNGVSDVFLRDLLTGSNLLVSVNPAGTAPGNGSSRSPVLSANGRFVAFVSDATNLVEGNPGGPMKLYLRDLFTGTTALLDTTADLTSLSITADGRRVAYQKGLDLYAWDTVQRTNILIGTGSGFFPFVKSGISLDGRWVLFQRFTPKCLYVHDIASNETSLLNCQDTDPAGSGVFSPNQRLVTFNWASSSYIYDLFARTNALICPSCANAQLSVDGHAAVFEARPSLRRDIVWQDIRTGATNLVSVNRAGTGPGNGDSTSPLLTYDGRYVIFFSQASDLVDNDTNNLGDIFVRDLVAGTTTLISVNSAGTGSGNNVSVKPMLGANGRTVLFESYASDLVDRDYNANRDVFVLRLSAGDSDGDGLDDDWEVAYLGTLERDGQGDLDEDGVTDLQEYQAGTNPADNTSVFRLFTLTALGGGSTKVIWSATQGKTYRVQFKDNVEAPAWSEFPDAITAQGSTASYVDNSVSQLGHRFYRVVLGQ